MEADALPLWPLVIYGGACVLLALAMLGLSYVLGERHAQHATGEPYECGIVATGSARLRFSIQYYLVAMLFVVFDLEAAFLFAWAIALRPAGWTGFVEALVFVVVLIVALVYLWREGALDWGPARRPERGAPLPGGHS